MESIVESISQILNSLVITLAQSHVFVPCHLLCSSSLQRYLHSFFFLVFVYHVIILSLLFVLKCDLVKIFNFFSYFEHINLLVFHPFFFLAKTILFILFQMFHIVIFSLLFTIFPFFISSLVSSLIPNFASIT